MGSKRDGELDCLRVLKLKIADKSRKRVAFTIYKSEYIFTHPFTCSCFRVSLAHPDGIPYITSPLVQFDSTLAGTALATTFHAPQVLYGGLHWKTYLC